MSSRLFPELTIFDARSRILLWFHVRACVCICLNPLLFTLKVSVYGKIITCYIYFIARRDLFFKSFYSCVVGAYGNTHSVRQHYYKICVVSVLILITTFCRFIFGFPDFGWVLAVTVGVLTFCFLFIRYWSNWNLLNLSD